MHSIDQYCTIPGAELRVGKTRNYSRAYNYLNPFEHKYNKSLTDILISYHKTA